MAIFAKINSDNLINNVIIADHNFITDASDNFTYIEYNENMVGIPEVGGKYENNKFYPKRPFLSWHWNDEKWLWWPPVNYPEDGKLYNWNEEFQLWDIAE